MDIPTDKSCAMLTKLPCDHAGVRRYLGCRCQEGIHCLDPGLINCGERTVTDYCGLDESRVYRAQLEAGCVRGHARSCFRWFGSCN